MGLYGNDNTTPPDYTPLANSSKESAEIMAKLGQNQLDESRRQYGLNKATADPVVAAQLELMKQTKTQGDDYYNYMKEKQRPVEDNLNATALAGTSPDDKALRDAVSAKMAEMGGQQGADAKMLSEKYNQYAEALKTGIPRWRKPQVRFGRNRRRRYDRHGPDRIKNLRKPR